MISNLMVILAHSQLLYSQMIDMVRGPFFLLLLVSLSDDLAFAEVLYALETSDILL